MPDHPPPNAPRLDRRAPCLRDPAPLPTGALAQLEAPASPLVLALLSATVLSVLMSLGLVLMSLGGPRSFSWARLGEGLELGLHGLEASALYAGATWAAHRRNRAPAGPAQTRWARLCAALTLASVLLWCAIVLLPSPAL